MAPMSTFWGWIREIKLQVYPGITADFKPFPNLNLSHKPVSASFISMAQAACYTAVADCLPAALGCRTGVPKSCFNYVHKPN